MKTKLLKLFKSRIAQGGLLLGGIAVAAATIAWTDPAATAFKLQGAWIAKTDVGLVSMLTFAQSDPSGRSAVFRNQMIWPPELLASLGLDAVSEEVAEEVITGPNTSEYTGIWYGLASGRIVMIFVDNSTLTFDSPTQKTVYHTITTYLASADADNDGYPDPGSTPVGINYHTSISKRLAR